MYVPMQSHPSWNMRPCNCGSQSYQGFQQAYYGQPMAHPSYGATNYYPQVPSGQNFSETEQRQLSARDQGRRPYVIDIEDAAERNRNFRTAIWTGEHLQVTLMSINVGEDIGLEVHPTTDQFIRIEEGEGIVEMGPTDTNLYFRRNIEDNDAIMIPAGMWHNITNTGDERLKLYSIYAPPEHPFGTIHRTKQEAMAAENMH